MEIGNLKKILLVIYLNIYVGIVDEMRKKGSESRKIMKINLNLEKKIYFPLTLFSV